MTEDAPQSELSREESDTEAPEAALPVIPPFEPRRLERELATDLALRWGAVIAAVAALVGIYSLFDANVVTLGVLALAAAVGVWLVLNLSSARISRELPQLAAMVEAEPQHAEPRIAELLRTRPLLGWVRLMLYDRLAGLRHRQQRFDESLAICAAVLRHRLGPARHARAHLLLMLAEAALERGDLVSAYHALHQLHHMRVSLIEALQRLALQTRYEVTCGYHDSALARHHQKIQLAEIMPTPQCGAMHAILATAATQTHQRELADWLWRRAELLCTPEQLSELQAGGFGTGIVAAAQEGVDRSDMG
ncbi:MAG: hypothetical protein ACODAQ_12795 [Phycisphaeraceae bacterium]